MKKKKNKKFYIIYGAFVYIFMCIIGCHVGAAMHAGGSGYSIIEGFSKGMETFSKNPFAILPIEKESFGVILLMTFIFAFLIVWLCIEEEKNRHSMPGKENGSAAWNDDFDAYNKVYTDPKGSPKHDGESNMILTQDVYLSMKSYETKRNCNVCVVGGSGSGKSRYFVKPNILQANCNYVITDPAGELLESTGQFLRDAGYDIKIFNLVEMSKSDCYNPFNYIRDDLGVLMMINCLIKNTNPDGKGGGDPFWEKSETALLQALCFYLIKYRPPEDRNFTSVMKLLRAAEIDENNPNSKSPLDKIFDEVEKTDPTSIALKQYKTFKMGAGKTLKSILISCSVRLTVFNLKQIENLTGRDTIDLATLGEGKKALFVIIPAADSTYNFLVSMMYSQLFETLYNVAETQKQNKRLDRHVRFLLDEFANIGQIPDFTKKLSTMRKYEISCSIILQTLAQLKTMYKDDWETICGNCDSFLFLGGQEQSTLEYISKMLGDSTIVIRNNSRSKGKSNSSSLSYNHSARKLMLPDEIARMNGNECILVIRGLKPFKGDKFKYEHHYNYKRTGDADASCIYVNNMNNSIEKKQNESASIQKDDEDIIEVTADINKAATFKKSEESVKVDDKVINSVRDIEELAQTLGIVDSEDIFSRFVVIEPEDIEDVEDDSVEKKIKKDEPNADEKTIITNNEIKPDISTKEKSEVVKYKEIENEQNEIKVSIDVDNDIKQIDDLVKSNMVNDSKEIKKTSIDKVKSGNTALKTIKFSNNDDEAEEFNFDD